MHRRIYGLTGFKSNKKPCDLSLLVLAPWLVQRAQGYFRERKKQAPRREPDLGLGPRTPGSYPGPKAAIQLLSHPGIPRIGFLCKEGVG